MRLLADAHTVVWAVDDPPKLSPAAVAALQDPANELLLGAGTLWEIGVKVGLGKLSLSMPYRQWMNKAIADLGAIVLPITVEQIDVQTTLPRHHRDPFDRLLVAQSMVEKAPIVGADATFDQYGVTRIW